MNYRSNNERVDVPMDNHPILLTSVIYDGEAVNGAVVFGQVDVTTDNQNFNQEFLFGVRIRGVGVEKSVFRHFVGDYEVPCLVRFSAFVLSDLVPGAVIDCLLSITTGVNWFLRERGFTVFIR